MALMIQLQWPRFGRKRATLFGKGKVPITLTNLGPLCVIRFDIRHAEAFSDFLDANVNLEDFLIEQAPRVRLAAKRAAARARVQERNAAREEVEYWRDAHHHEYGRVIELQQRVHKLETAVDVLSVQRAGKEAS